MACWGAAAAILLLAAVLRLEGLDRNGLSGEELSAVYLARLPPARMADELRAAPGATPLPYAVLRFASLYGLREAPLRLPAALAGVAAVALAMLLGRDLFGAAAGLAAGLLFAVSPLHLEISRTALSTSLATTTSLLFAWLLWRLLRSEKLLLAATAAGALAAYSGYAAAAVAGAALVCALIGLAARWVTGAAAARTLAAVALTAALFAPWAIHDLPSEPGAQFTLRPPARQLAAMLSGAPLEGRYPGTLPAGVLQVASLVGVVLAYLRGRRLAATFAVVLIAVATAAVLLTGTLAAYNVSAAQLLVVLPAYFGLAAFGLDAALGRLPSAARVGLCLLVAALVAVTVELPAVMADRARRPPDDWRATFQVLRRNLGRDDIVAAPGSRDAVAFYGRELARRLPRFDRPSLTLSQLSAVERGWLVAGWRARFDPWWPNLRAHLPNAVFSLDLSPAAEPLLLFVGRERRKTYLIACHFELPPEVVARHTVLRDCLREVGALPGPLRLLDGLVAAPRVSLRNASLLEAVALLLRADRPDDARKLAAAIVAREPDWTEARSVLAAVGRPEDDPRPRIDTDEHG